MNLSDLLRHVPKLEILKLLPPPDKAEVTHVDITTWNVDLLIEYALVGARIPSTYLVYMISRCKEIFVGEPNLVSITTEKPVYIIGDIHGSFHDMLQIFEQTGLPNEDSYFIFLGDIINRGFYGIECLTLILLFKVKYPRNVIIIRGNHESRGSTQVYGFFQECVSKYGSGREDRGLILPPPPLRPYSHPSSSPPSQDRRATTFLSPSPSTYLNIDPLTRPLSVSTLSDTSSTSLPPPPPTVPSISPSILSLPLGDHPEGPTLYKHFISMFDALPIAVVVHDTIFCVHGGLSPNVQRLSDIHRIDRFVEVPAHGPLSDLLWSDPDDSISQYYRNARGNGVTFGRNIVSDFLTQNSLSVIVRSHQLAYQGVSVACERVMTVWSAPNYCGRFHNKACFLRVAPNTTNTSSNTNHAATTATNTTTSDTAAASTTTTAAAPILTTATAASTGTPAGHHDKTRGDISDDKVDNKGDDTSYNEGEDTSEDASHGRDEDDGSAIVESTLNTHPIATSTVAAHTATTPLAHTTAATTPPATTTASTSTTSTSTTTSTTTTTASSSTGTSMGTGTSASSDTVSHSFPPLPTHLSFSLLPIPTCPPPLRSRMLELASEASKRLLASVYVATHPYRHLAGVAYGSECGEVSCGEGVSGTGTGTGTGTGMSDDAAQQTTASEASRSSTGGNGGGGVAGENVMSDESKVGVDSVYTAHQHHSRDETSTHTHVDTQTPDVGDAASSKSENTRKSENSGKSSFSSPFEAAVMMIRQYFDAPTINLPAFTTPATATTATTTTAPAFVAAAPIHAAVTTTPTPAASAANTNTNTNTTANTHATTTPASSIAVDTHPPLLVSVDPVAVAGAPVPLHTPPPLMCPSPSRPLSPASAHSLSSSPSSSSPSSSSSGVLSLSSSTSSCVLSVGQPTPIPLHFPDPTHTPTNDASSNDGNTHAHPTTSTTTTTNSNATAASAQASAATATNAAAVASAATVAVSACTPAATEAGKAKNTDANTTTTTTTAPATVPTTTIIATNPTHTHANTHAQVHLPRPHLPPPSISISPQLSAVLSTSTNTVLSDIPPELSSALPSLLPPALSTALTPRDFGPGSLHGRGILPGAGVVHGAAHNPTLMHPSTYGVGVGPGMGVGASAWMCAGGVSPHHPHSVARTGICLPRPISHSTPALHTNTNTNTATDGANTTTTATAGATAAVACCASTTSTPLCSPRSSRAHLPTPHAQTRVNYPPLRFARSGSGLHAVSCGVSGSGGGGDSGSGSGCGDVAMSGAGGSVHTSPSHATHAAMGTGAVDTGTVRVHRGIPVPAGVARYGSRGGGPHPYLSASHPTMSAPVPVPVPMTREQHAANIREQHRLAILAYQQGPKPPPRRFGRGSNNIGDVVAKGVVASGGLVHGATSAHAAASNVDSSGSGSGSGSSSGEDHAVARVGAGEAAGGAAASENVEEERKEQREMSSDEATCAADGHSTGSAGNIGSTGSCGRDGRPGDGAESGQSGSREEGTDEGTHGLVGRKKARTEHRKRREEEGEASMEGEEKNVGAQDEDACGSIKRMRVEDAHPGAE